ncbi:hypothetical protein Q9295_03290 [Xinfangfangia sp. CPCC 101601]|uniref:Lipoprotein n=1 Tax=Pseudogemmobacter lacusdianii TaxID=3069608 RepID=A0ABU0VWT8_9RHOB|nr:hypothetical protein [Xinfangfangia sp. CPCC 101601]MDQ2065385.1 hypothetical protein [Xinfangfangia sp. CPCC 101601]
MRIIPILAVTAALFTAGCVDEMVSDLSVANSATISHTDHKLTTAEQVKIQSGMASYLNTPVVVSGLDASYRLQDGLITVCGYATGGGPQSIFAAHLVGGQFQPVRIPGKGQDPARIAAVRQYCQANNIRI